MRSFARRLSFLLDVQRSFMDGSLLVAGLAILIASFSPPEEQHSTRFGIILLGGMIFAMIELFKFNSDVFLVALRCVLPIVGAIVTMEFIRLRSGSFTSKPGLYLLSAGLIMGIVLRIAVKMLRGNTDRLREPKILRRSDGQGLGNTSV